MNNLLFANIMLLANKAEGVSPVGTPIWVPIVIVIILLLLFLWGLNRNSIAAETAVSATTDHSAHEQPSPAKETRVVENIAIAPDDLRKIEGIGPKINSVLQAAGIQTFASLAEASITDLEKIVRHDAGITIAFPDTWPQQAALARDGKWDALEKLQDDLKGGRRA